ncbi:hypothetical protein LTR86_003209 [Recurvomyces mirabilis]|nr:hypothetical protein LTR86_003209 [Recurvomyces mirabilis]
MAAPPGMIPSSVDANCAICNAPPIPECPHEGERLTLALDQAMGRWAQLEAIRDWAVKHAKNSIISKFHQRRHSRYQRTLGFLQTLPCYGLYITYNGRPPITPQQLGEIQYHIRNANEAFQAGVNEDWRRSCMEYPAILDYFLSLVQIEFPADHEGVIRYPAFAGGGAPLVAEQRKVKSRRDSVTTEHRKKEKRRG